MTSTSLSFIFTHPHSGDVQKASIHPKFGANIVTQTAEEVVLWRKGSSGFKRLELQGLSKAVRRTGGREWFKRLELQGLSKVERGMEKSTCYGYWHCQ